MADFIHLLIWVLTILLTGVVIGYRWGLQDAKRGAMMEGGE